MGTILSLLLLTLAGADTASTPASVKVLIVGVFHFDTPGLDMFNPKMKDILGDRRQREILEVVKRLERFRPTKIAVEAPYGSKTIQNRLDRYLKDEYVLTASEIDQLALRLARTLGHAEIFSVDHRQDMDLNGLFKYAEENGQGELVQKSMAEFAQKIQPLISDEYLESNSMMKVLYDMNTAEFERMGHGIYMSLLRIGKDNNYAGADLVGAWNTRNLKIATNLIRITDRPDDRVLLIIGSGHAPMIRLYLNQTPGFVAVDAHEVLKP